MLITLGTSGLSCNYIRYTSKQCTICALFKVRVKWDGALSYMPVALNHVNIDYYVPSSMYCISIS